MVYGMQSQTLMRPKLGCGDGVGGMEDILPEMSSLSSLDFTQARLEPRGQGFWCEHLCTAC